MVKTVVAPFKRPVAPEQPEAKLLFEFTRGGDRYRCELRAQRGVTEARFCRNGRFFRVQAFRTRAKAVAWALRQRDEITRNFGIW
jgi:hypothetical protein